MYEKQFVVLDDAKHVIGVDGSDLTKLIIENPQNQKADKFGWSDSFFNFIASLLYDELTGFLYSGDTHSKLLQYKIDTASKTCQRLKDYGDLRIGKIYSCHRFLDFVFFGGSRSKIRVLDLSTGELLPGCLETAIEYIFSLHVCVKSHDEIYLAVSGSRPDYSEDKTDLFDVRGLFLKKPNILLNYLSKHSIDDEEATLFQPSIVRSKEETSHILLKKRNSYKDNLSGMNSKYEDLKESKEKDIK